MVIDDLRRKFKVSLSFILKADMNPISWTKIYASILIIGTQILRQFV